MERENIFKLIERRVEAEKYINPKKAFKPKFEKYDMEEIFNEKAFLTLLVDVISKYGDHSAESLKLESLAINITTKDRNLIHEAMQKDLIKKLAGKKAISKAVMKVGLKRFLEDSYKRKYSNEEIRNKIIYDYKLQSDNVHVSSYITSEDIIEAIYATEKEVLATIEERHKLKKDTRKVIEEREQISSVFKMNKCNFVNDKTIEDLVEQYTKISLYLRYINEFENELINRYVRDGKQCEKLIEQIGKVKESLQEKIKDIDSKISELMKENDDKETRKNNGSSTENTDGVVLTSELIDKKDINTDDRGGELKKTSFWDKIRSFFVRSKSKEQEESLIDESREEKNKITKNADSEFVPKVELDNQNVLEKMRKDEEKRLLSYSLLKHNVLYDENGKEIDLIVVTEEKLPELSEAVEAVYELVMNQDGTTNERTRIKEKYYR